MLDARSLIGQKDILWVTLDTLRFDVATYALTTGLTPNLQAVLPGQRWEKRHTPSTFTYGAHHAFFAGFLPTPAAPGRHPRLFGTTFLGSETTTEQTAVFDHPDVVSGLSSAGYHTICIGGVGFFNQLTPLGCVLPSLFAEAHWSPQLGVTSPQSAENQVSLALDRLNRQPPEQRIFLFINIAALHQPNYFYLAGATEDSPESQAAALSSVDQQLPPLFEALRKRGGALCVVTADHGTAYGEDGYHGHRLAHPTVWDVPYAEWVLEESES